MLYISGTDRGPILVSASLLLLLLVLYSFAFSLIRRLRTAFSTGEKQTREARCEFQYDIPLSITRAHIRTIVKFSNDTLLFSRSLEPMFLMYFFFIYIVRNCRTIDTCAADRRTRARS